MRRGRRAVGRCGADQPAAQVPRLRRAPGDFQPRRCPLGVAPQPHAAVLHCGTGSSGFSGRASHTPAPAPLSASAHSCILGATRPQGFLATPGAMCFNSHTRPGSILWASPVFCPLEMWCESQFSSYFFFWVLGLRSVWGLSGSKLDPAGEPCSVYR